MKRDCPSLLAALTTGLLVNVLLRSQSAYWPRAGVASALICVPAIALVGWLFSRAWRSGENAVFRFLFAVLLLYTSVLELLQLWNLSQRLYPGILSLAGLCLMTLLPVIYLRRVSSISQTAHVVLCLLVLATGFMLITVLPQLHITNLQNIPMQSADFAAAFKEQLTLYPEYLLPALWPLQAQKDRHPLLRLAAAGIWFDVGIHGILELFYGAAMPVRLDPIHAVARCGALSIFNRLESLQLILWIMAITLKLALYLYAVVSLLPHRKLTEVSIRLDRFPLYFCGIWLACIFLQKTEIQTAMQARNIFTWLFMILVVLGGAAAWLTKKIQASC